MLVVGRAAVFGRSLCQRHRTCLGWRRRFPPQLGWFPGWIMCLASAYRLKLHLLPHARRLSVLTTSLRLPIPVGSCHDAFALRFDSHETWQHPSISLGEHSHNGEHSHQSPSYDYEIGCKWLGQVTIKLEIIDVFAIVLARGNWQMRQGILNSKLQVRN